MGLQKFALAGLMITWIFSAQAAGLPADVQSKMEAQVAELTELAKDADIIAVAKAGAKDSAMNNAKWQDVAERGSEITSVEANAASAKIKAFNNAHISKIYLRDIEGNYVAGFNKPFLYNISKRPNFKKARTGSVFIAAKIQKDPTTQENVVQVAVPVLEGGKVVGILHAGVRP